jgi:ABC-type nitrate/sulfonate/bicarbonate transport system substrate-binding protein
VKATAFAPGSVGNVGPGFDVLGLAVEGPGDEVRLERVDGPSSIEEISGLDAELIPFKGGPDLLKGVLSGSADIGITGATDPLVFRERGTPIRTLATIVEKNHFTLTVVPKVKRLEDLKGGTIGCTVVGSTTWVFARMLAKKMNWDPEKDVRIIGVGGLDAQMAALKRGEIQGTIFGDAGGGVLEGPPIRKSGNFAKGRAGA